MQCCVTKSIGAGSKEWQTNWVSGDFKQQNEFSSGECFSWQYLIADRLKKKMWKRKKKKKEELALDNFLLLGNYILVSHSLADVHASGSTAYTSRLNFLIPRTPVYQGCGHSRKRSQVVCHSWWGDVIPKMHLPVKCVLIWAGLPQSENKTGMNQDCKRLLTLLVILIKLFGLCLLTRFQGSFCAFV